MANPFNVGDVIRVLGNEYQRWAVAKDLDEHVGKVGIVTRTSGDRGVQIGALNERYWFDSQQCEIAQIKVGDRVITEAFESGVGGNPHYPREMHHLAGKAGVVEHLGGNLCIRHDIGGDWYWPRSAVKFALDGDVAAAPQKAAVEAPKALGEAMPMGPEAVVVAKKAEAVAAIIPAKDMRTQMNEKAAGKVGVSHYAIQFKDGGIRFQIADICHARIGCGDDRGNRGYANAVAITTGVKPFYDMLDGEAKANYKLFAEYITQRSIFRDCFLPCSDVTKFSVYMNMKRSVHNIAAACIALREGSEQYSGKVSTFVWLIKQGISEDAAWVASRCFIPKDVDGGDYTFRSHYAHDTISTNVKTDVFFKVFKDGLYMNDVPYADTKKEGYRDYQVYACTGGTMYGGEEKGNLTMDLKRVSGYKEIGEGWNKVEKCNGEGVIAAAKYIEEQIAIARGELEVAPKAPKFPAVPKGAVAKGPARDRHGKFVKVAA